LNNGCEKNVEMKWGLDSLMSLRRKSGIHSRE
jgi:hypothetical protein